ncbi:MAG: hypothetical protein RRA92_11500 [Gemmatimonadota bacterium]|nr:hypothetical protein [Gemmatimonadota bacterium]
MRLRHRLPVLLAVTCAACSSGDRTLAPADPDPGFALEISGAFTQRSPFGYLIRLGSLDTLVVTIPDQVTGQLSESVEPVIEWDPVPDGFAPHVRNDTLRLVYERAPRNPDEPGSGTSPPSGLVEGLATFQIEVGATVDERGVGRPG